MYPVSEAYKNAIAQNERNVRITGTITLKDESIINITDEDIVQGSLYFTEQCVSGEDIEIGNVYASEMGLSLSSPPENPYSLDGARIILNFGIETSEGVWEYVPLGYFYVTEIERKATVVNLKALDGMILFDVPMDGVLTVGTPYALIDSCCTKAGVTLATGMEEFQGFANGLTAFTIPSDPSDSKIETCRDLLMWVCQLTGTFARMNRLGQLEIIPITGRAPVKTISKDERFVSDVSDFEVKVTKVAMKLGEEEYSQGTAGMTLALEENPLLAGKSEAEINAALAEILAQVTEAEYTPYNLTCAGDPALQAGDWVKLTGVSNINGPEVEYSRDSPAIHPDTGEEIPEDTPVFVDFAEGKKGSLMVEGTENLFVNPMLANEGESWGKQASNILSLAFFDEYVRYVKAETEEASITGIFQTVNTEVGKHYSVSYRIKHVSGEPQYGFAIVGSSDRNTKIDYGNTIQGTFFNIPNDGQYHYVHHWFTAQATTATIYIQPGRGLATGLVCDIARGIQLEQKPYPTSFTDGTRANPVKRITLPEALPDEFGIGVSFKPLHTTIPATRTWLRIRREPHSSNNRIYIITANDVTSVACGFVRDGTTYSSGLGGAVEAGKITGIYYHQEPGKYTFYVRKHNGEIVSGSKDVTALTGLTTILVGCSVPATQYAANAILADFVLHDRPEDIDPMGYLSAIPGGGEE